MCIIWSILCVYVPLPSLHFEACQTFRVYPSVRSVFLFCSFIFHMCRLLIYRGIENRTCCNRTHNLIIIYICVLSVHGYSYVMLGAKCLLGYEVSTGMRYVWGSNCLHMQGYANGVRACIMHCKMLICVKAHSCVCVYLPEWLLCIHTYFLWF
jgi:hypothetical protein